MVGYGPSPVPWGTFHCWTPFCFKIGLVETCSQAKKSASLAKVRCFALQVLSEDTNSSLEYVIDVCFDRSLYASLEGGYGGVVGVKTGKAILLAVYNETIQSGRCIHTLEKLADHLIGSGV